MNTFQTIFLNPFNYFCYMNVPKIPSFFNTQNPKKFNFTPRYYSKGKERKKQNSATKKTTLKFRRLNQNKITQNERRYKIIFFIIILSLLSYKLLI